MQVPDFLNARIAGEPAVDVIGDEKWFREEFTPTVANRGEELVQCKLPTHAERQICSLDIASITKAICILLQVAP